MITGYIYKVEPHEGGIGKLDKNGNEDEVKCFYINLVRYEIHDHEEEVLDTGINICFEVEEANVERTKKIIENTMRIYDKLKNGK